MPVLGEREIEEAFFREAWRMEVETCRPGVWYSGGSLMEGQMGVGAVNIEEQTDPYVYTLGHRATVWDGEMNGIQMALEGAEKEKGGGAVIAAADR